MSHTNKIVKIKINKFNIYYILRIQFLLEKKSKLTSPTLRIFSKYTFIKLDSKLEMLPTKFYYCYLIFYFYEKYFWFKKFF